VGLCGTRATTSHYVAKVARELKKKMKKAETQKLEAIYHQKLLNLEELKKSVLQKAFAGELTTEKERIEEKKKNKK
jgi:predicted nucleic acid-binding protein